MPEPSAPIVRRHDLDALRSLAMLLGIALHAALAYVGPGWIVSDDNTSKSLGLLFPAVHGFRMPLFFLLSGFFTAMLWQRRGLAGLLSQRAKRILLPLTLACLTIVPAMNWVSNWAISEQTARIRADAAAPDGAPRQRAPTQDIWAVAAYADLEGLRAYPAGHELLDAQDPAWGVTPLGWTALSDTPDATAYLLSVGANPSAQYKDLNTPMHTACFFGRADVAEHLLRAGADLTIRSAAGEVPADSLRHNQQTTEFIANLIKIPIDFEQVAAGRERIRQMIADPALVTPAETTHQPAQAPGAGPIARLQNEVFFHHLWFLWFLVWLNVAFAALVLLGRFLPKVPLPAALVASPLALLWLVPLTMLPQLRMQAGGTLPGFGPDTSAGLIPVPHVFLYYAIFFGFGAIVHAARGPGARLGRLWPLTLTLALILLPLGLVFGQSDRPWLSALAQVMYAWLMIFALLGLCETLLAKDRPWIRYLSDSSYWLYLAHLPLIIAGQALLLRTDLPGALEFSILLVGTTALLLVSYRFGVRYTPIGTLLNGRRTRGTLAPCNPEPQPSPST